MNPYVQNYQIDDGYSVDYEQLAQEDALFPWLASDCMADYMDEELFYDDSSFSGSLDFSNDF
jgi:hypothetical protein